MPVLGRGFNYSNDGNTVKSLVDRSSLRDQSSRFSLVLDCRSACDLQVENV